MGSSGLSAGRRLEQNCRRLAAAPVFYATEFPRLRLELARARRSAAYQRPFTAPRPLVSVCVGTYQRAELLTRRALPSILAQDYRELEVIVVGDACTDDTGERIAALGDRRVRWINLPRRGEYPAAPSLRHMVAGTATVNRALAEAQGEFITHLDDDDEYLPGRIRALVAMAQRERAEFVWHPFWYEDPRAGWVRRDVPRLRRGAVSTGTTFYHRWWASIPWDAQAYRFREPGDWHRIAKLRRLGCRMARHSEPWLRHYTEELNPGLAASPDPEGPPLLPAGRG
ncbi:MAG: glycosyltransferase family 2 protein [Terriglobales bacterium]